MVDKVDVQGESRVDAVLRGDWQECAEESDDHLGEKNECDYDSHFELKSGLFLTCLIAVEHDFSINSSVNYNPSHPIRDLETAASQYNIVIVQRHTIPRASECVNEGVRPFVLKLLPESEQSLFVRSFQLLQQWPKLVFNLLEFKVGLPIQIHSLNVTTELVLWTLEENNVAGKKIVFSHFYYISNSQFRPYCRLESLRR